MPFRSLKHQAGSAAWVLGERTHASSAILQEVDDFAFSAADHMEWLNEHMADIFNRSSLTMAEISKTPGKLRSKPPMTARRRNMPEERAPLTDVFASTPNINLSPAQRTIFFRQLSDLHSTEDKENGREISKLASETLAKENEILGKATPTKTFSAMREQDQQNDRQTFTTSFVPASTTAAAVPPESGIDAFTGLAEAGNIEREQARRSETVESFVSAKQSPSGELLTEETTLTDAINHVYISPMSKEETLDVKHASGDDAEFNQAAYDKAELGESAGGVESPAKSESYDSSDASSPERPILRKKSSLTFATLPARETLLPKKSMGTTISRASYIDASRSTQPGKNGPVQESTQNQQRAVAPRSATESHFTSSKGPEMEIADPRMEGDKPETSNQSKTSTQRLHERITMLSKARPAQSLMQNQNIKGVQVSNTTSGTDQIQSSPRRQLIKDNDWIQPAAFEHSEVGREAGNTLFIESSGALSGLDERLKNQGPLQKEVEAPSKPTPIHQTQIFYPTLPSSPDKSTTPTGSPARKAYVDGPLSASKAKLFDMFKSARGIFASSQPQNQQAQVHSTETIPGKDTWSMHASAEAQTAVQHNAALEGDQPCEPISAPMQQLQTTVIENEKPPLQQLSGKEPEQPQNLEGQNVAENRKVFLSTSQIAKHGDFPRPGAKSSQETNSKSRPAPVSVRVASQRMGQNVPSTGLGPSIQEGLTSSTHQRQPTTLKTKSSISSIRSGVAGTIKSNSSANGRPKALEVAARKREQDEREAQRKADQKRELERKRVAKAGEERRTLHEQKSAEQPTMESKQAPQHQTTEQRRTETVRKADHLTRTQSNWAAPESTLPRDEQKGFNRATSNNDATRPAVPHINPAKPPKRYFQPEEEEPTKIYAQKATGFGPQGSSSAKRRRTSETGANGEAHDKLKAMAPPVRLSTMHKSAPGSKFVPNYMSTTSSTQVGQSMLKAAINAQHQTLHPKTPHDMTKYSNARIPFADGSNSNAQQTYQRQQLGQSRTPAATTSKQAGAKSSPMYPDGDSISLPEIATDSEDEDSDDEGFVAPDWAHSPALRELLSQQQLVDPINVFGPIAPLQMEEIFRGNKERIVKFRKRTSSANWNGPDRLTEEERRKDFEAREKLMKDGGWTFNPNL